MISLTVLQRAAILAFYLLTAIELVFMPIPSEASTFSLFLKRRSSSQIPLGPKKERPKCFFLYLSAFSFVLALIFFLLPLLWSFYPGIESRLLPIGSQTTTFVKILSILAVTVGGLISFVGVLQLRAALGSEGRRGRLKTDGIFSISRNPIQFGLHLSAVGFVLTVPSLLLIVGFIIYVLHVHQRILIEETYLESKYKTAYQTYKKSVGRYFVWL